MPAKRPRVPHFIAGIGDGNADSAKQNERNRPGVDVNDDLLFDPRLQSSQRGKHMLRRSSLYQQQQQQQQQRQYVSRPHEYVRGRGRDRIPANEHFFRTNEKPPLEADHWKDIFANEDVRLSANTAAAAAAANPAGAGLSLYSAFVLLGMIVLVSALFLHFITDSGSSSGDSNGNASAYGYAFGRTHGRTRRRQQQRQRRLYKARTKKKTDEWSDDEEDMPYDKPGTYTSAASSGPAGASTAPTAGSGSTSSVATSSALPPPPPLPLPLPPAMTDTPSNIDCSNDNPAQSSTYNDPIGSHNRPADANDFKPPSERAYSAHQSTSATHATADGTADNPPAAAANNYRNQYDPSSSSSSTSIRLHPSDYNTAASSASASNMASTHYYHAPKYSMSESQPRYRNTNINRTYDSSVTATPPQQAQPTLVPDFRGNTYAAYYNTPNPAATSGTTTAAASGGGTASEPNDAPVDTAQTFTIPPFKTPGSHAQLRNVNSNRSPAMRKSISNLLPTGPVVPASATTKSNTSALKPRPVGRATVDASIPSTSYSAQPQSQSQSRVPDSSSFGISATAIGGNATTTTTPESSASSASKTKLLLATPKADHTGSTHSSSKNTSTTSSSVAGGVGVRQERRSSRKTMDIALPATPEETHLGTRPFTTLKATPLDAASNFSSFESYQHDLETTTMSSDEHSISLDNDTSSAVDVTTTPKHASTQPSADSAAAVADIELMEPSTAASALGHRSSSVSSGKHSSSSSTRRNMYSSVHGSLSMSTHNHLLLSPGYADDTPRVGNVRKTYDMHNSSSAPSPSGRHHVIGLHDGLQIPSIDNEDENDSHGANERDVCGGDYVRLKCRDDGSAAGTDLGSLGKYHNGQDIPFLPNLQRTQKIYTMSTRSQHSSDQRHVDAPSSPPRSLALDELHLVQMETGNSTHWQVRDQNDRDAAKDGSVASVDAANQRAPLQQDDTSSTSFASETSGVSDDDIPIPSDDPHKNIHHVRADLTMSTDAANSLKTKIQFEELKLQEVIGGGGFGQIWRATWRGTPVAVKILTGSAQGKRVAKSILQEFKAEINLLKGMRHPNICLYMGACFDPPNRAIITELAANGSVWDALRLSLNAPYVPADGTANGSWPLELYVPDRHGVPPSLGASPRLAAPIPPKGTWPWKLVKTVASGAAQGMAYLHSGDPPVLHRDLKSANLLLTESYTAKVCDFGLSRLKSQERSMTGNCGTVQWMAPEVLANMKYNEKADIYSFGIICWELLSRECPYDGMSAIQCALAVLNRDKRPDIPKWCPPPFQALIRSCIKKDPGERPTFEQIILALDAMP